MTKNHPYRWSGPWRKSTFKPWPIFLTGVWLQEPRFELRPFCPRQARAWLTPDSPAQIFVYFWVCWLLNNFRLVSSQFLPCHPIPEDRKSIWKKMGFNPSPLAHHSHHFTKAWQASLPATFSSLFLTTRFLPCQAFLFLTSAPNGFLDWGLVTRWVQLLITSLTATYPAHQKIKVQWGPFLTATYNFSILSSDRRNGSILDRWRNARIKRTEKFFSFVSRFIRCGDIIQLRGGPTQQQQQKRCAVVTFRSKTGKKQKILENCRTKTRYLFKGTPRVNSTQV